MQASLKSGDRAFNKSKWDIAIKAYERYNTKHPGNFMVVERLATLYRITDKPEQAAIWYEQLYAKSALSPENIYHYGQVLRSEMKYDKAQEVFQKYIALSNSKTAGGLAQNENQLEDLLFKNHFSVGALEFNTENHDFAPYIHETNLFFTSDRLVNSKKSKKTGSSPFTQILSLDLNGGLTESAIQYFFGGGAKSKRSYSTIAIQPSSQEMYTSSGPSESLRMYPRLNTEATSSVSVMPFNLLDIKGMEVFSRPFELNSTDYSIAQLAFNEDGSIVYFSSDMPGGFGSMDLWMAQIQNDGSYGTPVNLGSTINTEGNEMYPSYQEGKLYFASNGLRGLGGLDIYSSQSREGAWTLPTNLGYPINTNYDDFSLIFQDEHNGFFTSNRLGGMGGDDIYSFNRLGLNLKVLVYNADTKEPIQDAAVRYGSSNFKTDATGVIDFFGMPKDVAKIQVAKNNHTTLATTYPENDEVYFAKIPMTRTDVVKFTITVLDKTSGKPLENSYVTLNEFESYSDEKGQSFWLIYPGQDYLLSAAQTIDTDKKYLTRTKVFNTNDIATPDDWNATILLDYFEIGKEIELDQIYYDLGKSFISTENAGELDQLVVLMNRYPEVFVEIGSHTDCRASKEFNQKLSENRAEAAMEFLVRNGINANRLAFKGYGETKLANACACECEQSIASVGADAFRKCEDAQVENCSEEDHQANRRTTFKVVKF